MKNSDKNDELNDPLISEEHISAFDWATPNELEDIEGKLTTGELNEGDYLDKCNSLKKQYNNIKFASM